MVLTFALGLSRRYYVFSIVLGLAVILGDYLLTWARYREGGEERRVHPLTAYAEVANGNPRDQRTMLGAKFGMPRTEEVDYEKDVDYQTKNMEYHFSYVSNRGIQRSAGIDARIICPHESRMFYNKKGYLLTGSDIKSLSVAGKTNKFQQLAEQLQELGVPPEQIAQVATEQYQLKPKKEEDKKQ